MQEFDELDDRAAARRLRCIQQITEADDETLQIVSAVLDRARPIAKPQGRKRGRPARNDAEKGGGA
jgi:hypothetical protein